MLTIGQVDYFRTFGFVVLRGYLADPVSTLRAEADTAIRDAYAATYNERVFDGISGHYLPVASRLTPVSTSLVCDDPRLIGAAEQLPGGPVIPDCPEGVLYFSEAGWHTDDGIGVRGVKFAYFDQLTAGTGALRLVPGSHHPEQNARLSACSCRPGAGPQRGGGRRLPGARVLRRRGDPAAAALPPAPAGAGLGRRPAGRPGDLGPGPARRDVLGRAPAHRRRRRRAAPAGGAAPLRPARAQRGRPGHHRAGGTGAWCCRVRGRAHARAARGRPGRDAGRGADRADVAPG